MYLFMLFIMFNKYHFSFVYICYFVVCMCILLGWRFTLGTCTLDLMHGMLSVMWAWLWEEYLGRKRDRSFLLWQHFRRQELRITTIVHLHFLESTARCLSSCSLLWLPPFLALWVPFALALFCWPWLLALFRACRLNVLFPSFVLFHIHTHLSPDLYVYMFRLFCNDPL